MRCLITADLHYSLKQFDWVLRAAPGFDLVVLAGDHLDIFSSVDGRAQILVVLKYLERLATLAPLLISSGNHDLDAHDSSGERTANWILKVREASVPTDGEAHVIGDTLFTICPWWDGPNAKERIAQQLARDAALARKSWVWIYHSPPKGSPTGQEFSGTLGEVELADWIDQYKPDLVFCGHAHNAPFWQRGSWVDRIGETWVFNAGKQIGDVPAHIVIDTERQAALWFSIAGIEIAQLSEPRASAVQKLTEPPAWLTAVSRVHDPSRA